MNTQHSFFFFFFLPLDLHLINRMELQCPSQQGNKSLQIESVTQIHCALRANQNFFYFSLLLLSQWQKPSSGSLTTDGDTVGGWLELPSTMGGSGRGEGWGGWLAINQGERGGAD